jgi:dTDP-4-dehydrorhamnose 3,5-epimerase
MKIVQTSLPGVLLIEPKVIGDARGFFIETFHERRYAEAGITGPFLQDNLSRSVRGTLRGLHFQEPHAQGKLVSCLRGTVFDVAVDIRRGSPTFGRWFGAELSDENYRQMWVPPGFAHGVCVLSDHADFSYKCTALYRPEHDRGIAWDDPEIGVAWPIASPLLSAKDQQQPRLRDAPLLPAFRE